MESTLGWIELEPHWWKKASTLTTVCAVLAPPKIRRFEMFYDWQEGEKASTGLFSRHLPPALGRNLESYESRISFIVADKFAASCWLCSQSLLSPCRDLKPKRTRHGYKSEEKQTNKQIRKVLDMACAS